MKVIIFAGTTEGRELSAMLDEQHIAHAVCVASEYGSDMIGKSRYTEILTGRMDAAGMKAMLTDRGFTDTDVVVDATHPYAEEVSRNIREAVAETGCEYVRITRHSGIIGDTNNSTDVQWHDTLASCIDEINDIEDGHDCPANILLTTGSKELHEYCSCVSDEVLNRTYVRVLPSVESLELCKLSGIALSHIIAMQGPFSYELNKALMQQYKIGQLITKESGTAGGFDEKVRAALDLNVAVHVIRRPDDVQGVSIQEAYGRIVNSVPAKGLKPVNDKESKAHLLGSAGRNIILCGCGMGSESCMTGDVKEAIINADAVFGSKRMLEFASACRKSVLNINNKITEVADEDNKEIDIGNTEDTGTIDTKENKGNTLYDKYLAKDIIPILEENTDIKSAAILFSGDSGFYSGAKSAAKEFSKWDEQAEIKILPGISSVSYLASKLGESYDDAVLFSLHGRSVDDGIYELLETVRYNRKTFLLLSGSDDIKTVVDWFDVYDIDCLIYAGCNLSYADEAIDVLTPENARDYVRNGMITALVLNKTYKRRPVYRTFKDDDFIRDAVPMTKECVRHESILRLGLKHGDVVYDIGGGTGSVAIEIAAQDPSIRVYTFERKKEAAALLERNINCHGGLNVTLINGEAPEALKGIEAPDSVFIGGSSGRLEEIIAYLSGLSTGIRYVINAVSLETIEEIRRLIDKYHASDVDIIQLSVSNAEAVGTHHLLKAQNPVMIFSFRI